MIEVCCFSLFYAASHPLQIVINAYDMQYGTALYNTFIRMLPVQSSGDISTKIGTGCVNSFRGPSDKSNEN